MPTIGAGHAGGLYSVPGPAARRGAVERGKSKGFRRRPDVEAEVDVQETGLRNRAQGADKFGFKDCGSDPAGISMRHRSTSMPSRPARPRSCRAARSVPRPASTPAAAPRTSTHTSTRSPRARSGGKATARSARRNFQRLYDDFIAHARGKKLFAQDLYGGADPKYRINTRVYTEYAWHSLFIRQLLIRPTEPELEDFIPELTIVDLPSFKADPKRHGVRSETIIALRPVAQDHPDRQLVLCG